MSYIDPSSPAIRSSHFKYSATIFMEAPSLRFMSTTSVLMLILPVQVRSVVLTLNHLPARQTFRFILLLLLAPRYLMTEVCLCRIQRLTCMWVDHLTRSVPGLVRINIRQRLLSRFDTVCRRAL